jgi:hypothetical protein
MPNEVANLLVDGAISLLAASVFTFKLPPQ